jgi:polyphosphate kinase 2 (PPK2 family)
MFEAAELGRKVTSGDYKKQVPALREELLDVQRELSDPGRFPVIILFGGVDGAGKSESVNLLSEWMDPRWLLTRAYGSPSEEERERPEYWRFWRDLPPKGRIGFFLSAWYSQPFIDRVYRRIKRAEFGQRLDEIITFERCLSDDGALILKFWMHLDKAAQKARLKKLEQDRLTRWRVTRINGGIGASTTGSSRPPRR